MVNGSECLVPKAQMLLIPHPQKPLKSAPMQLDGQEVKAVEGCGDLYLRSGRRDGELAVWYNRGVVKLVAVQSGKLCTEEENGLPVPSNDLTRIGRATPGHRHSRDSFPSAFCSSL